MSEPIIYTVDRVTEKVYGATPCWLVHKTDQEGNGSGTVLPQETLEWRAAEYGLTDISEIIDIILHEPLLPDSLDRDDAAARVGLVTSTTADAEPVTLFNADASRDALAAHRLRIADAKATRARVVSPAKGPDPLNVILARPLDAARVRELREAVDLHRWSLLYGGLPVRPPSVPSSSTLEVPRA